MRVKQKVPVCLYGYFGWNSCEDLKYQRESSC